MKRTHMELLFKVLGKNAERLSATFSAIGLLDRDPNIVIDEQVFDKIYPPDDCSMLFMTPDLDRSSYSQRKMDLAVLRQTYHLWKDKNYFDITSHLIEKLNATDLKDIDTFFLRAPYRSMYLSLPKGNGLYIANPKSGLHEVESIYLLVDDYPHPTNIKLKSGVMLNGITKYINMLVCGEVKHDGDTIMFFDLLFWEGKISDSVVKNKDIIPNPLLWPHIVEVFNFVVKILLYINCANVSIRNEAGLNLEAKLQGLKNPAKRRKLLQKYEKISPKAHKVLDVIIHPGDVPSGSTKVSSHLLGPKSLEKVRGHFKAQRYGKDLSESKIIWIEPYIRGEGTEFYKDKKNYKVI